MAPSFEVGNPQKSLVRIPGSGTDKDRKPVCLEIAQITNFAQADVIPKIQRPPPELHEPNRVYRLSLRDVASSTTASASSLNRTNGGAVSRKRPSDNEPSNQAKKTNADNNVPSAESKTSIIKNLLRDKEKLEEENQELRKKIMMFKDLLKNKPKLDEFLEAIGQAVPVC